MLNLPLLTWIDIVSILSYLLISPTSQSTRSMKWLKSHIPEDGSVFVSDVTSLYTALNVIGPKAKYLLSELSDENFNDFARMTCRVRLEK
jgi:pyruvate dehydrogenase phosphatase regulatory subunit